MNASANRKVVSLAKDRIGASFESLHDIVSLQEM